MVVVLVGSPLSGKTSVLKKISEKGIKVFHTDSFISKIYQKGNEGYELIKNNISNDFVNDVEVDKKKLAIWCTHDENLKKLNELIHPLIKKHLEEKDNYVCELPIISSSPIKFKYDKIVLVTANDEIIKKRFEKNNINNLEFILKIISSWKNIDDFDYKIDTSSGIKNKDISNIINLLNLK